MTQPIESWLRPGPEGLFCVPGNFHIDPHQAVERAVITHGHSDHARPGHDAVLATAETLEVMRVRLGAGAGHSQQALALLKEYFLSTPDPDRGYALAAITDGLPFSFPARQTVLDLASQHIDAELFRISRDYVVDTAETLSLIWPNRNVGDVPSLAVEMET